MASGLIALVSLLILTRVASGQIGSRLETYNVDRSQISVGGISSGGLMASQLHVAYSSKFMGVGVIAGGPYYCAEGGGVEALRCSERPEEIDIALLGSYTLQFESGGEIDSTRNMNDDRVWVFNGALDTVVVPGVSEKVAEYYSLFVNNENIYLNTEIFAQHGQPTMDRGGPCDTVNRDEVYLNLCGYEAAYEMLNYFYGGLLKRPERYGEKLNGELITYNTNEFFPVLENPRDSSMDEIGYIYVPSGCADKTVPCKLHVSYHGCDSGSYQVGDFAARNLGYNEVGEANNIIILYPQAVAIAVNPMGCWDWWGYNDPFGQNGLYAKREGHQVLAVGKMIDRVSGA